MAELVNMQQSEYDEVLSRLITLHQEEIESIKEISQKICTLCEKDGGFYIKEISNKINRMFDNIDTCIMSVLEENFKICETAMETFMAAVKQADGR